jgi:hypothetical protein
MSVSDRGNELIQKYLESLASDTELAELEQLLTTSPEAAAAFAEAARLHAGLSRYFQRQYKIDQVAALLDAGESEPVSTVGSPASEPGQSGPPAGPAGGPAPGRSTFVPTYQHRAEVLRRRRNVAVRVSKFVAALLLIAVGVGVWLSAKSGAAPLRLVSGRVRIAGQDVTSIPVSLEFEVTGREHAVIELPGGARMTLAPASRAIIRRSADRAIVVLNTGGGDFTVDAGQPAVRIETEIGTVTATNGRFSIDLVTVAAGAASTTMPQLLPNLVVAVAEGSIAFERAGWTTVLSAGERRVFTNAT